MNLDPQQNKVGDIRPDSPKEITPGNLPQQTPEDGDFRASSGFIGIGAGARSRTRSAHRFEHPQDFHHEQSDCVGGFAVCRGFCRRRVDALRRRIFQKEKTVEKADIAIVAPEKFAEEQQRILLETTASEPVIEAASTPITESQPASADSATAQTMPRWLSEPAAPAVDLRLESELMIPVNRSNATAAAPGSSDTATDSGWFRRHR